MNKQEAKEKIAKLIDKYDKVKSSGNIRSYTEEETKKDFILPLFEALGWEVFDKNEVSAEENISGDRVDYGFYLDGKIKFYLEAKKLSADSFKEDFANQAINYSWNRGATWAILTNFEHLKVFNAQVIEKDLSDKQFFEIPYNQYLERFDQLDLLSKEAFQNNLLDKKAEEWGKKLQRLPVNSLLYKDLQRCRDILTEGFGAYNEKVDKDLLDEGIQKLLDRLIFIRVCEDRGIEEKTLIPMVRDYKKSGNWKDLYSAMVNKFEEFNEFYNSNLFTKHAFEDWEDYSGSIVKVIDILYGKLGYYEYDFRAMPADVLGTVYENYLSYRLLKSKKGVTVDKDAKKRKEQGIYYTPSYIVDYIVENTLGPVLAKCKSIEDIKRIKVLDPACGSGSFLIKAVEVINKKYIDFGAPGDESTKLQILIDNIYGVDLDEKAVEICRLNLLVSVLEERKKLPLLTNIRNGNSLISGKDDELEKQFGKNFRDKKPFNWEEEFPEVFKRGGFDVIIGNPPYIKEFVNKSVFDGLHKSPYYEGKMDIWTMFACISIDLLKENGLLSFIAPNNWVTNAGATIFRNKILKEGELKSFIDFNNYKVFEHVGIQTMIFVFQKREPSQKYEIDYLKINDKNIIDSKLIFNIFGLKTKVNIEPKKLIGDNITFSGKKLNAILYKIKDKQNFKLNENEVAQGIVGDPDKAFIFSNELKFSKDEDKILFKYFTSVGRYRSGEQRGLISYLNKEIKTIENYPSIKNQIVSYGDELKNRREVKNNRIMWFQLHWPRDKKYFDRGPKIISAIRTKTPNCFYTKDEYYGSRALNFIKTDRINLEYLTAILNSKISYFWLKNKGKQLGDLLQIDKGPLIQIPIFVGNEKQQKAIIQLVDKILKLNKELKELTENSEKWNSLKREIEKVDKKIEEDVYKLYGLTEEEIKIIENQDHL